MSLDSIIAHIDSDARAQREKIIRSANDEAEHVLERARMDAQKAYAQILSRQKSLAESQRQKRVVAARLQAKKDLLAVKQGLIQEVFEEFKSQLLKEQVHKTSVFLDREVNAPEDVEFYLAKIRSEHESEIARILFQAP
ncbi:MAG TPA: V-type ATP synthase subunit E family protein [Patescibacteria group bacterium]|nr:V-type ATP synthase subunit E family protein [Patescibacteria group bacterium]